MVLQGTCFAVDPTSLVETLSQNYRGKSAVLRGFYCDSRLEYDVDGNHLQSPKSGAWTACGFIKFKEFKLKENKIEIRGQRTGLTFDKGKFVSVDGKAVNIKLALKPDATAASLHDVLNAVFYDKQTQLIDIVPDYWKCYVEHPALIDKFHKCEGPQTTQEGIEKKTGKIGGGVSAPRPIHNPDPGYTTLAREHGLGGAVLLAVDVNEGGGTENISILSPLGLGLDDMAVAAVKNWKFEPARRGGTPIVVHMTIELYFHPGM
jgi:TonB family protein